MPTLGQNFIDGQWQPARGNELVSANPATGETLWSGRESTSEDVDAALTAARSAARHWSLCPLRERAALVDSFGKVLESRREELALAICREVGKPLWEAATEVEAMLAKIPVSIAAIHERRADAALDLGATRGLTRYKPLGVIAVFGPFNFPGHISNGHIVPALLAGNSVVFKPSELTPWVAELMTACWVEAGLPAGVLNLVQGGRETGIALVQHPAINGVLFTGSLRAGVSISRTLAERPEVLVALELGGNNPLVVDDVDNIDAAVYMTIQSAYLTSGQRCTCSRRLIAPDGNDAFLSRLLDVIRRLTVDRPENQPAPLLGSLIHSAAVERILDEQRRLVDAGGTILVEAQRLDLGPAFVSPGLVDVTDVTDRGDDEVFGPLLQLVRVRDFDAALREANRTQYGLVAGLLSSRPERSEQFFRDVNAGLINWNTPTTGASGKLPFGGTGRSGNHRPAGYFTIDACNVPVASMESAALSLPDKLLPGVTFP